jgi:hypothetical protein
VVWVPRVAGLSELKPFLDAAATLTAFARPESYQSELHPLMALDVFSQAALLGQGIDPTGSITISKRARETLTCLAISDAKKFAAAAELTLGRLGTPYSTNRGLTKIVATRDPLNRVQGAYSMVSGEACAVGERGGSVEVRFGELSRALTSAPPAAIARVGTATKGPLTFSLPHASTPVVFNFGAHDLALRGDFQTAGRPRYRLSGPGPSPFARFSPNGGVIIRARVAPRDLPAAIANLVRPFPGGAALDAVARPISNALTGNVALFVKQFTVRGALSSDRARFFTVKFAILAELSDVEGARRILSTLDRATLAFPEGKLEATIRGTMITLSNDAAARDAAFAGVEDASGAQSHGLEVSVNARRLAEGLAQVSLFEVAQVPELMGLVAVSTELGPLLMATKNLEGWAETSASSTKGQFTWTLDEEKFRTPRPR